MIARLSIALALAATGALAQSSAIPNIAKDTDYAAARKTLLAQGFTPERLAGASPCDKSDPRCFPEAFSCAGTGVAACLYVWKRGDAVIEIRTVGEQPIVDSLRCRSGC